jgi:hypothetical protein
MKPDVLRVHRGEEVWLDDRDLMTPSDIRSIRARRFS